MEVKVKTEENEIMEGVLRIESEELEVLDIKGGELTILRDAIEIKSVFDLYDGKMSFPCNTLKANDILTFKLPIGSSKSNDASIRLTSNYKNQHSDDNFVTKTVFIDLDEPWGIADKAFYSDDQYKMSNIKSADSIGIQSKDNAASVVSEIKDIKGT